MRSIAVYGKGGIGKSTCSANLSASWRKMGLRVLQIGCDPKADSCASLMRGQKMETVLNVMQQVGERPSGGTERFGQAGILETLLERLATYKEKILAIKSKIKSALFYPIAVICVAIIVTAVIMIFVIPAFKEVFTGFGADLPAPTLIIIAMSDFMVANGWLLLLIAVGSVFGFFYTWRRSETMQIALDRLFLRLPIFGDLIRKSVMARWTRTLSTMFAAGVPLVESLESVGGAAGNYVYKIGTRKIQSDVSTGVSLTNAMQNSELFPNMVVQMVAIGEESGSLDAMLGKVADFYEAEVDDAVEALSSLMEPLIMVILGVVIGGMVVAMYLPIFKLGAVV